MDSKPYVKLDTAFIYLYKILGKFSDTLIKTPFNDSAHNYRKSQLYTYLACRTDICFLGNVIPKIQFYIGILGIYDESNLT